MPAIVKFTTVEAINKEIESIAKAGAKFDARVQVAAVSVLAHYAQHKDVRLVNRLYLALPRGARKAAMAEWLLAHAAVSPNPAQEKEVRHESPFVYDKAKATDVEAGAENPWYDFRQEKEPAELFDAQKAALALIAKAAKAVKDGKKVTGIQPETLAELSKIVAKA